MDTAFTPSHRGGTGPPLVCLHGFTDTWRTWEPTLAALERRHDVLAPTLAGHAGGPSLEAPVSADSLAGILKRERNRHALSVSCKACTSLFTPSPARAEIATLPGNRFV